jgi:transposase
MDNTNQFTGIDVSMETIDAAWYEADRLRHIKLPNTTVGFRQLLKQSGNDKHYVMESTGPYYVALALFLHQQGAKVSVVNAVVVKRFIQMHLEKSKSDKKDAVWLCKYGNSQQPEVWQAPEEHIVRARQMQSAIMQFTKQRTAAINALKSLEQMPIISKECRKSYEHIIRNLNKQIQQLENELEVLLKQHEGKKLEALKTIPGIGKRTAAMLLIATDGFRKTESHRQLASYAGLSPREYTSGKSIKGRVRISKQGVMELRNLLFMCSMTAIRNNKACKEMYDRLTAKGKSGKLALIAVSNKLIKQCVAIAKTEQPYNENYFSQKACF